MPEDTKIPKWEYRRENAFSDELNDDFSNSNIKAIKIDKDYKYIHKNIFLL